MIYNITKIIDNRQVFFKSFISMAEKSKMFTSEQDKAKVFESESQAKIYADIVELKNYKITNNKGVIR